ncbi:hypothetical protein WOLCODRAFT_17517 [Wolfiporia cocos MD-104 SS10]|uniref:DUF6593 domain-containing protein n=1 Tax=Wolfiporia cocos (strain MD-104) TaxID=742152 RepID=A0A2H3JZG9_WOLCO|nr:hypothetical protein WOLCODRAFT_17517 [Wolfiporia cocos MD-104 SS10]
MPLLEQSTVLIVDPDDMNNTSISLNGRVLYNVTTEHSGWKTSIHIRTAEDAEIASLHFRDIGLPSTKVRDDSGTQYKWKGNAPGQSLQVVITGLDSHTLTYNHQQLFLAQDTSPHPVAFFKRSTRIWESGQVAVTPATLVLTPRADEIRDLVVASFVFLERERRGAEISGATRRLSDVAARGSTAFALSTGY